MAVKDGDTIVWLQNKLGSADDFWLSGSISAHITPEKLRHIDDYFAGLPSPVKIKFLLSILHLPKRNVDEWSPLLDSILNKAQRDSDPWTALLAALMGTYPSTGSVNTAPLNESIAILKKSLGKNSSTLTPYCCSYMGRAALATMGNPTGSSSMKHFSLKRKPKSAALRMDILQKASDAAGQGRTTHSIPVKFRSSAKKMDNKTPLPTANAKSMGFFRSSSLARSFAGNPSQRSVHREGGIKLLDISEMPLYGKRRRRIEPEKRVEEEAPEYAPPLVVTSSPDPTASSSQTKKALSLTREQMMEAQEMFRTSNKVTRPEKALILGFMAGSRDNPCPHQGDLVNIRLSEANDIVEQPDGTFRPMLVDTYIQMNYATGVWRKIKKLRTEES